MLVPPLILVIASKNLFPHTQCEGRGMQNGDDRQNMKRQQSEKQNKENHQSCDTCLYTGMATCTGLALYFGKLALEVPSIAKNTPKEVAKMHRRSKYGFLTGAAVWVAVGAYRWHLG